MSTNPPPDFLHTLADELRLAAQQHPQAPFLRMLVAGQPRDWSFAEIDALSEAAAHGLRALGVQPREHVSLMLPNVPEFVVLWFALAKLGAVAAPVNTAFRGQALRDAVNLVDSRLLIAHDQLGALWEPERPALAKVRQCVRVGGVARGDEVAYENLLQPGTSAPTPPLPALPPVPVGFADRCLLLYTSGTTGRSKAAMISHRFVLANAAAVIDGLGLRRDDVLYCPYPLFHLDAAVMTLAPALLLRAVAAIGERFSVSRYWDEMRLLQATVFDFMGATLTMLWKQPPSPQDRQHRARLGWGVPLPEWAPQFEERFGCRLVELYGSTEAGALIFTPLDAPRRLGSCGKVHPRWSVALHDEHGFAVPVGAPGELVVRPNEPGMITDGYYGQPEATAQAFRQLWFHTGDVLRADADGYLYFVGRRKDMVRRRGENIACAEVELGLETHPQVMACAVYGVPSELTEEDVMACVVRRPGSTLDGAALIAHAQTVMARHMVPRYVRFVDTLPTTPTDKVEKFRLQQEGITPDTWDHDRHRADA